MMDIEGLTYPHIRIYKQMVWLMDRERIDIRIERKETFCIMTQTMKPKKSDHGWHHTCTRHHIWKLAKVTESTAAPLQEVQGHVGPLSRVLSTLPIDAYGCDIHHFVPQDGPWQWSSHCTLDPSNHPRAENTKSLQDGMHELVSLQHATLNSQGTETNSVCG